MIQWGRKRSGWWVAMVLPGFLLRALIPLGFMPMFGPGHSVGMMLCPGYVPAATMPVAMPAEMSMDMSMDMPVDTRAGSLESHGSGAESGGAGHQSPAHQDHGACPYGASPTLATLALPSDQYVAGERPASNAALSAPQIDHADIAPRAQSPRGPPQKA